MDDQLTEFFGLGNIQTNPNAFNITLDISKEEYARYSDALARCGRLTDRFGLELVERNFIDLNNLCTFVSITLTLPREFATPNRARSSRIVMGQIVNWLTATRLFLDHAQTDLKRRFGQRSSQVVRYEELRSAAFDGSFGYRFLYKFRNYVQHCGLPLSTMSMTLRPGVQESMFPEVEFLLDPQALLESYDEWGLVKKDLRALGEPFPLLDVAREAMEQLRIIARELLLIDIVDAVDCAPLLQGALDRIGPLPPNSQATVFHGWAAPDHSVIRFSSGQISTELVQALLGVAAGAEPESLIHSQQVPKPSLDLDPQKVADLLRAESRGVQLMASYVEKGVATPEFAAMVNRIIAEDSGIQPLVDGLVTMSAVLLYMTAGALGVDPKGLLSGLLDYYRPSHERPRPRPSYQTKPTTAHAEHRTVSDPAPRDLDPSP